MTRIVKMVFRPEHTKDFLALYASVCPKINSFPGCGGVQLLQDLQRPEIIFTYSQWESEEALHRYRHSDLFIETWRKTRALFAEKAEAWSTEKL